VTEPVCDEQHCITCGDEGVAMIVLQVDANRGLALCAGEYDERATVEPALVEPALVETALVEPVAPGDRLLVHAGTAIAALEDAR
jgi:hydrogenase maturation factor